MRYTRRQIELYYRQACRHDKDARRERLRDMTLAFHAENPRKLLRDLKG